MKRIKDISELNQKKDNLWEAKVEIVDELTPFDIFELHDSLDNTCYNIEMQIKQGRSQISQMSIQIKELEKKVKHFQKKRSDVKKIIKLAEPLLSEKEKKTVEERRDETRKMKINLEKRDDKAKTKE